MKKTYGFTLVELLVVMSVLAIAGVFILNIFTSSLRGSNKSQILGVIKQNGQGVLDTMDKTVRDADNVVCPFFLSSADTTAFSNTLVTVKDGIYTRYRLLNIYNAKTAPTIPYCGITTATGCFVKDNPAKQVVNGVQQTEPQFVDSICQSGSLMSNNVILLTDNNLQTGISVGCVGGGCTSPENSANAVFLRNRSSGFKDQITIRFIAKPGVNAPQAVAGQIDPVSFQTTINLR